MVKHYLWLSAITSKVTKFPTIETILVLAFHANPFPTLALLSTITGFVSSFSLRIFTLSLVASRALCSSRFILNHESLLNRFFSEKLIFFKLNMINNIIKCFDVVVIGKVNTHIFPITWQRTNQNLDLLLISHLMSINH